jgi:hypothetical protein
MYFYVGLASANGGSVTDSESLRPIAISLLALLLGGGWLQFMLQRRQEKRDRYRDLLEKLPPRPRMTKGASGADRKKFGTRPKRAATSRSKSCWLVFGGREGPGRRVIEDTQ